MKKASEKIGYAMLLYFAGSLIIQFILAFGIAAVAGFFAALNGKNMDTVMDVSTNGWVLFWESVLSTYIAAPIAAWLFMKKLPDKKPEKQKLTVKDVVMCICVCLGTLYLFGYFSEAILWVASKLLNMSMDELNAVNVFSESFSTLQYVLLICVGAPIVEELFFRGVIVKKMLVHGRFAAIILSAAVFGLVHGTLSQIPYTVVLGLVLGYIYVRYGNILLNIALHMIMNFMGGVLYLLLGESDTAVWIDFALAIMFIISAIVIVIANRSRIRNFIAEGSVKDMTVKQQMKAVYINAGFIIFACVCLAEVVLNILLTMFQKYFGG